MVVSLLNPEDGVNCRKQCTMPFELQPSWSVAGMEYCQESVSDQGMAALYKKRWQQSNVLLDRHINERCCLPRLVHVGVRSKLKY